MATRFGTGRNDRLFGSSGDDIMYGFGGDDVFLGSAGADVMNGGSGVDTADYSAAPRTSNYPAYGLLGQINGVIADLSSGRGSWGDASNDTYYGIENLVGSAYNDALAGDSNVNAISGGGGDDIIVGGQGGDALDGGTGYDFVAYVNSGQGVFIDLQNNKAKFGDAEGDTIRNFEGVIGSQYADNLRGNGGDNAIYGQDGSDVIWGGDGNDDLYGEAGNDNIDGGSGNDRIDGGAGYDVLAGGAGADTFVFSQTESGADTITDFTGGEDHILIGVYPGVPAEVTTQWSDELDSVLIQYPTINGGTGAIIVEDVTSAMEAYYVASSIGFY